MYNESKNIKTNVFAVDELHWCITKNIGTYLNKKTMKKMKKMKRHAKKAKAKKHRK